MGTWCKGFWSWCGGFLYEPVFKKFLFSWDISENSFCLPENDKKRLGSCLLDDLGIDWAENAEICKHHDEKTIRIAKNENAVEITIDEQEEKATLKISDDRTIDLKVKKKGDKLKIFYVKFPHSQVWRVLVTLAYVCISIPFLCAGISTQLNISQTFSKNNINRIRLPIPLSTTKVRVTNFLSPIACVANLTS